MFDARIARRTLPLMLIALATTGCAPGHYSVRVRTADGRERTTVPVPRPPVAIPQEEFQSATASLARAIGPAADPLEFARQRFEVPAGSGWFFFDRRTRRITPLDPAAAADFLPAEMVELTRSYLQWCHNRQEEGDCLRLLRHGYALDAHGRYAMAMAIALGSVLLETRASLEGMANMVELQAMVVCGLTLYLMLWALPEPISKGVAAVMTAALVVYLGVDTLYALGRGWKALIDRADEATTFDELQAAGERFGKVMGANTARIMVMLTTAVLGDLAGPLVKPASNLPRAAQASRFATREGAITLSAVSSVEVATITESGITLTLAPVAVAMSTTGSNTGGGSPGPRRPSREERIAQLLKDEERGVRPNDPTVRRQAEVAADMEEQGLLKGPVRQPVKDDGHSGDFIDGNGQDWDVKRPHSRPQLEEIKRLEAIRKGWPPPKFNPKTPLGGEFDLNTTLNDIHGEFAEGENVIIDTSRLNDADIEALRQALIKEGILGTKVLMYP